MVEDKVLYRYHSYFVGSDEYTRTLKVYVETFKVIRETAKCYVIMYPLDGRPLDKPMYVLKGSNGKRYAYDTQEAAYNGYLHRCCRRELITRRIWENSKEVYESAKNKEKLLSLEPRKPYELTQ